MTETTAEIVYFTRYGREYTESTLRIANRRAKELNIKTIVVASTSGESAVKATEICDGVRVIAVGHTTGHRGHNVQSFTEENRQKIESKGGVVLLTREAFGGLNADDHDGQEANALIANSLRMFGQGSKVACEVSIMAADSGLVRVDEDIIAVAATSKGSDTALVLKPANSASVFELRVREILCRPYSSSMRVESEPCIACNNCVEACSYDVLVPNEEKGKPPIVMYPAKCAICYDCLEACPVPGAILMQHPLKPDVDHHPWNPVAPIKN